MRREVTAATRLIIVCNPNNPTSTALPLEEIAAFVASVPRHIAIILDEAYIEFSLLQDPDDSLDLLAPPPQPRAAAHVLEGLRPVRAARRLRAVRLGGLPHRGRPGAPAVLLQRRRAGRRHRGAAPPGRGRPPRGVEPGRAPRRWRTACAGSGSRPPSPRPTSSGSTSRAATTTRSTRRAGARDRRAGSPSAACSCAPAPRSAAPGALRVTVGTDAHNTRFLEALGALL